MAAVAVLVTLSAMTGAMTPGLAFADTTDGSPAAPSARDYTPAAPKTTTSSTTSDTTSDERTPLSSEDVAEQTAKAAELTKKLAAANASLAAASAKLTELSTVSQQALAQLTAAREAQAAAQTEEDKQKALLQSLAAQTVKAQEGIDDLAYNAYVNGSGGLTDVATILDLVTNGAEDSKSAATVDYLSQTRSAEERRLAALTAAQQATATRAIGARQARESATTKAQAAATAADTAVAKQRTAMASYQALVTENSEALRAMGLTASITTAPTESPDLDNTPLCTTDNGTYENGRLPMSALCPIDGYPGHMMRPKAARALNALKKAYALNFGRDLCITDTYRSYAAQVDVKRRKPTLAATPGTSQHGWGYATDLCGGIESFGTAQFLWMKQNAPLYGFFHPSWAEPSGSKPEPWHWEYVH